jgi:hypothetical protein
MKQFFVLPILLIVFGLIGFFIPGFFHRGATLNQESINRNRNANKIFALLLLAAGIVLLIVGLVKYTNISWHAA